MQQVRILVTFSLALCACDAPAGASGQEPPSSSSGRTSSRLAFPTGLTTHEPTTRNIGDNSRHSHPSTGAMGAANRCSDGDKGSHATVGAKMDVTTKAGMPVTSAERDWLAQLPVLRVGVDPTSAPLTFVDRHGEPVGLSMDYLEDALAALGVAHVAVHASDWADTVKRAGSGDIDILAAASPRNGELGRRFGFTRPYIEFPVMIVTREDTATIAGPADLGGRRVAANMAQGAVAAAVRHLPRVEEVDVRDTAAGLDAVMTGRVDAYVGDIATAEYVMRRDYPARLKLAAPTDERAEFAIAVERRYAALIPLLDRALAHVTERRAQAVRNTWLRSRYTWGGSWREVARKAGPAGAAILALLLAVSYAYLRLRHETRRRRSSEERLADVTRHIPAVFYRFRYHADGRIEFIHVGGNPGPIFDVTVETFLHDEGRAFARIDPRDQAALLAEVARAASTLTPIHAEMRIRDTVPERWVASHALPRLAAGAVEFTGYWIDISDRHAQAAQLAEATRVAEEATAAKSRFLATMSHEIRTPMHGLIGMLEMLRETPLRKNQRRLLGTAESSAEALLRIVDDVLDFSRIEAGAVEMEYAAFDLRQLVDDVVALFGRQTRIKELSVNIRIDPRLAPWVICDASRLRQVLLNLVGNAVKFTARGGIGIAVDVMEDDATRQRVRIDVVDTGIGVVQADIDRLFAPFSQAEPSISRRFGGSGLGLAISRRLVGLMGGDLAMSSEAGAGTRLTILLDMERSPHPGEDIADSIVAMPSAANAALDVLVAEDNPASRQLIAAQLERLGHRHVIVADGAAALDRMSTQSFDVLLTDLHMPVMDGYALTRALRERGSMLRILAMTANATAGEEALCHACGMDGFAIKPLRLAALATLLSQAALDLDAWRDTYGDLALLPVMVARFEGSAHEDMAGLVTLTDPSAAADGVHRILGGMRIFGPSPEAAFVERLENALRGAHGAAAMRRLPELASVVKRYAARLRAALDAQCTEHMLKK